MKTPSTTPKVQAGKVTPVPKVESSDDDSSEAEFPKAKQLPKSANSTPKNSNSGSQPGGKGIPSGGGNQPGQNVVAPAKPFHKKGPAAKKEESSSEEDSDDQPATVAVARGNVSTCNVRKTCS